jgi:hypothetical protein
LRLVDLRQFGAVCGIGLVNENGIEHGCLLIGRLLRLRVWIDTLVHRHRFELGLVHAPCKDRALLLVREAAREVCFEPRLVLVEYPRLAGGCAT